MNPSELKTELSALNDKLNSLLPKANILAQKEQLTELDAQINDPKLWDNPTFAGKVTQEHAALKTSIERWHNLRSMTKDLFELLEIAEKDELEELNTAIDELRKTLNQAETELLLSGEFDKKSAILSIHVGNGGQDAEDFCQILYRQYLRYAEKQNFKVEILEESNSDVGLRSAMISIKGLMAYGLLKSEHGVHRLIRLSPFNAKSLRQTSFAKIEVIPEVESENELVIDANELRIDVFRSGGAGGQSVNTTDSAVRITYLPLGISVTCQNERSQQQNKATAMKVLQSRLIQLKNAQKAERLEELRGDKIEASFSSQIRSYTLQPYKLVKDHRTNYEEAQPEKVFDGAIDGFVQAYLRL